MPSDPRPAVWVEAEPYWGCPVCESREWSLALAGPTAYGRPPQHRRCAVCGTVYLAPPCERPPHHAA